MSTGRADTQVRPYKLKYISERGYGGFRSIRVQREGQGLAEEVFVVTVGAGVASTIRAASAVGASAAVIAGVGTTV